MATENNSKKTTTQLESDHLPATATSGILSPTVKNSTESIHNGIPNHLSLAAMITLRTYQLHRDDEEFNFTITMNDPNDKHFGDVTVHYTSAQCKGALFIEANDWYRSVNQHEQKNEHIITPKSLFSTKDADDSHSIAKYLFSFLNIENEERKEHIISPDKPTSDNGHRYVVFTNSRLDHAAVKAFNVLEPKINDILSFASTMHYKCYQLDHDKCKDLPKILYNACSEMLGQLMASHIYHRKLITDENALFTLYADLIERSVEQNLCVNHYTYCQFTKKFRDGSIYGYDKSTVTLFRHSLESAYDKLTEGKRDLYKDEEIMFEKTFFKLPSNTLLPIHVRLTDFCKKFILVCCDNTSDDLLPNKILWDIKQISKTSSKTEQKAIFKELQNKLTDAVKHKTPIHPQCVENAFTTAMLDKNMLKIVTRQYLQSLKEHCLLFMIRRDRLKKTRLYTILNNDLSNKIMHYRGSSDIMLNRTIVLKTIAILPSCKAVFIGCISPEIIEHLDQILINPSDVFKSPLIVIVIAVEINNATLERMSSLMASSCVQWKHKTIVKIILLENSTKIYTDPFLVCDLACNFREELFKRYEVLPLFGTRTSLDTIVLSTDCLTHLKHVLDISNDKYSDKNNINISKLRYDKIKSWYIHRTISHIYFPQYHKLKSSEPNFLYEITPYMDPKYYKWGSCSFRELNSFHPFVFRSYETNETLLTNDPSQQEKDNYSDLHNKKEKVITLLDESGAGKTVYFTWLAWRIQTHDPMLYVIHFNAAEHGSALQWLALDRPSTIDTVLIRTLFKLSRLARTVRNMGTTLTLEMIREERKEADRLAALFTFAEGMVELDELKAKFLKLTSIQLIEVRLFREKLNGRQVVILLDGIDELEPTCRASVLQFVERLSHFDGVEKLYFATNPQFVKSEVNLFVNLEVYKLNPFTTLNAVRLLHRLLLERLDAYRQCDRESQLQLVPFLYWAITNSLNRYCHNVPLLLYMMFIISLPVIKRCVDFKVQRVHGGIHLHLGKIDSIQLITTYIAEKLDVSVLSLLTASTSTNKHEMTSVLKRQHALLGFCITFGKQYTDRLLTDGERTYAVNLMRYGNEDIMKAGFVRANHDGKPMFSNRMFAEYFAACWLFENRSRLGYKHHVMSIAKMFTNETFTTIRNIFNRKTIEGCEGTYYHNLLCSEPCRPYRISFQIERNNAENVNGKDATGRTLLHWLSSIVPKEMKCYGSYKSDLETTCKRMLETATIQQIHTKDELFGWSALDYAFFNQQFDCMRVLLTFETKVDIDIWLHQLRSYDLEELFKRIEELEFYLVKMDYYNRIIQDNVLACHVLSAVSSGVVKHIIYEKEIDISRPLAELNCLTVLEYCAERDLFSLFEHFILINDSSKQTLDDIGPRLLELSIEHSAYRVAMYLMKQCDIPWNLVNLDDICKPYCETDALLFAMELKSMRLFRLFFNQICEQNQYPCLKDKDIVEESYKATIGIDLSTRRNLLCHIDTTFYRFSCTIQQVLATAFYQTKFHIISYIVQKIQLSISCQLLKNMMSISHQFQNTCSLPEASRSICNYLLDRTNDLHSFNDNGNTLFDYAANCDCVVMMQCLIDRGLDPLKNYAFHDLAWTNNEQGTIEIFQQLLPYCSIDQFYASDKDGYNVCENGILKKNFRIARMIIHTKAYYVSTEKRISSVLYSFMGLLKKEKFQQILDFLTSSYKHADDDWKDVYTIIHRQIPII